MESHRVYNEAAESTFTVRRLGQLGFKTYGVLIYHPDHWSPFRAEGGLLSKTAEADTFARSGALSGSLYMTDMQTGRAFCVGGF